MVLTAALARTIGSRTEVESRDLLMQDAQEDLFAEAVRQLGRPAYDPELQEVIAALHAPLHDNCYMSPTQFTERFGLTRLARSAPVQWHSETDTDRTNHKAMFHAEAQACAVSESLMPRTNVTADELAGQQFIESHHGIAIFRLADGRYHIISHFAVTTLNQARAAAEALAAAAGIA